MRTMNIPAYCIYVYAISEPLQCLYFYPNCIDCNLNKKLILDHHDKAGICIYPLWYYNLCSVWTAVVST